MSDNYRRRTVRGALQGTNEALPAREVSVINRCFLASAVLGWLLAVVFFVNELPVAEAFRLKLYGAFGVWVFVTVIAFAILNLVVSVVGWLNRRGN